MRTILGMTALAFSAGLVAAAQDVVVYGGAELEFLHEEYGPGTGTSSPVRLCRGRDPRLLRRTLSTGRR